jgi:hypothetical protein
MARVANIGGNIPNTAHRPVRSFFVQIAACGLPHFQLTVLLALAATGCSTTHYADRKTEPDYVRPDYAQRNTNLVRVVVIPPQVDILRLRFWRERKAGAREAAAVSLKLQRIIEAQLRYAGFVVQTAPANSLVPTEARKRFDEWMNGLSWADSPETLGPTAKVLADEAHADALVCVRFDRTKTTWQRRIRGYHTTAASYVGAVAGAGGVLAAIYFSHAEGVGGEGIAGLTLAGALGGFFLFKETSWLITGGGDPDEEPLPNRAVLHVAFVDGATGDVLWSNSAVVESGDKDPELMAANVFLNFPR